MDERTRRELLLGATMLLGFSAGCQNIGGDEMRQSGTGTDTDGGNAATGSVENENGDSAIYVRELVADLPNSPKGASFGITGDGVYRFDTDNSNWEHVRFGSAGDPVPAVNAVQMNVGTSPSGRPVISNGNKVLYIDPKGGDDSGTGAKDDPLATIQEAVRRVPIYLRDQYVIDLATVPKTPVTYDEDVLVPTVIGTGQAGHEDQAPKSGPIKNLVFRGAKDRPGAVKIGSVMFGNVIGTSVAQLLSATITRDSPYDDESHGLSAYGMGEVHLYNIRFTSGPTNGVLSYGTKMKAVRIGLGQGNLRTGIHAKRHASIVARQVQGKVTGTAFFAKENSTVTIKEGNHAAGSPRYQTRNGGLVYNLESDSWYGFNDGGPDTRSAHPKDADAGDIWYVDGAGNVEEGFYGQTSNGPTKLG